MSDACVSLRQFAEVWVDAQIAAEADPEARAMFVCNYDRIVAEAEAAMRHQLAEQGAQDTRH